MLHIKLKKILTCLLTSPLLSITFVFLNLLYSKCSVSYSSNPWIFCWLVLTVVHLASSYSCYIVNLYMLWFWLRILIFFRDKLLIPHMRVNSSFAIAFHLVALPTQNPFSWGFEAHTISFHWISNLIKSLQL